MCLPSVPISLLGIQLVAVMSKHQVSQMPDAQACVQLEGGPHMP